MCDTAAAFFTFFQRCCWPHVPHRVYSVSQIRCRLPGCSFAKLYMAAGHVKLLPGPVCHMNERMQSSFGTWKPWQ